MENSTKTVKYKVSKLKRPAHGTYIALVILCLWILVPFYILLESMFKHERELNGVFTWWPEQGVTLEGFKNLFSKSDVMGVNLGKALWNTLWMSFPSLTIGMLISAMASFGFAKLHFKGKNTWFGILMLTMMLPGCATTFSKYILFDKIGWTGNGLAIIIPGCFGGIGVIFFVRQYVAGIPNDLIEAAKIDGMEEFGIFFKIILPLAWPALLAQLILSFIGHYNDYLGPLLYLDDPEMYTLQIALKMYAGGGSSANGTSSTRMDVTLAGCALAIVPLLGIYLAFQNFILNGISMSSGLKG